MRMQRKAPDIELTYAQQVELLVYLLTWQQKKCNIRRQSAWRSYHSRNTDPEFREKRRQADRDYRRRRACVLEQKNVEDV